MTTARPKASKPDSADRPVPLRAESIVITIDGPAGTGKSSVARELARRLGLDFLDTGAMYRAAAAIVLDRGIDRRDVEQVVREVAAADLHFDWQQDPPVMLAWGRPIADRLRQPDVEAIVSAIAAIGPLRRHLVTKQRLIAAQHPRLVTEGRDQGSEVFPDAEVKFYLDAEAPVRARRRAEQLEAAGHDVSHRDMLQEILERDELDRTRADGPLVCPEDAHSVDTTAMTFEEVVATLERIVRERVAAS